MRRAGEVAGTPPGVLLRHVPLPGEGSGDAGTAGPPRSPFGYEAVGVPPDRVAPAVALGRSARRARSAWGRGELRPEPVEFLRTDWSLDEHQPELLELPEQHLGHRLVRPAVEVDGEAGTWAGGRPGGGDALRGGRDLGLGADDLEFGGPVHLHSGEAFATAPLAAATSAGRSPPIQL